MAIVKNIGSGHHRYEHRETHNFYVFPIGEHQEVPDEVAEDFDKRARRHRRKFMAK